MGRFVGLMGRFERGIGRFENGIEWFVSGMGYVRYSGVRSESWVVFCVFEVVRSKNGGASFASKPVNW